MSVNTSASDVVSAIARTPSVGCVHLTRTNAMHELALSNRIRVLCVTSLGAEPVAPALRGDANSAVTNVTAGVVGVVRVYNPYDFGGKFYTIV